MRNLRSVGAWGAASGAARAVRGLDRLPADENVGTSMIYRIAEPAHWAEAQQSGEFRSPDLAAEGFIHFSEAHQVRGTADRYYRGRGPMWLLAVDEGKVAAKVVRENTRGGQELFPHVYGPVPLSAVLWSRELPVDAEGRLVVESF